MRTDYAKEVAQLHEDMQMEMRTDARFTASLEEKLKRYDPLDVKQLEYFGKVDYKRLRDAANFHAIAHRISIERGISVKEIYSNWMSPH